MGAVVPQRADAFAAHHPCIEVAGGVPGGLSVEGRVDIVRPALEALHLQPASGERTHQRDPRRRLPLPGSGGGKAKCVKCRVHGILPKFWGRGKLPEKGPSPVPAVPCLGLRRHRLGVCQLFALPQYVIMHSRLVHFRVSQVGKSPCGNRRAECSGGERLPFRKALSPFLRFPLPPIPYTSPHSRAARTGRRNQGGSGGRR